MKNPKPKRDVVPGLGAKMREYRTKAGLKATDLTAICGVHQPSLSVYESDARAPTLAVLMRLAKAYGVSVCDFLPAEDLPLLPPAPPAAPAPASPRKRRGKA